MGNCIYCGKPAGIFRGTHEVCKRQAADTEQKILGFFSRYVRDTIPVQRFREMIEGISASNSIYGDRYLALVNKGIKTSVQSVLEDRELTESEELEIYNLIGEFNADASILGGTHGAFYQSGVLRKIKSGVDPETAFKTLPTNILMTRGEYVIWRTSPAMLLQEKKHVHYEGGSSGFSFRIASGVYYRIGSYKGQRVETKSMAVDVRGEATVTNRALYVSDGASQTKKFLIGKIISVTPYEDGLGFAVGGANPKPYILQSPDSWFLVNCISSLAQT